MKCEGGKLQSFGRLLHAFPGMWNVEIANNNKNKINEFTFPNICTFTHQEHDEEHNMKNEIELEILTFNMLKITHIFSELLPCPTFPRFLRSTTYSVVVDVVEHGRRQVGGQNRQ